MTADQWAWLLALPVAALTAYAYGFFGQLGEEFVAWWRRRGSR